MPNSKVSELTIWNYILRMMLEAFSLVLSLGILFSYTELFTHLAAFVICGCCSAVSCILLIHDSTTLNELLKLED